MPQLQGNWKRSFGMKKYPIVACCPALHSKNLAFPVKLVLLNQFLTKTVSFCLLADLALNFQTIL